MKARGQVRTDADLRILGFGALFVLASCAGSGGESEDGGDAPATSAAVAAAPTCAEPIGSLEAAASLNDWAGEYTLTMVGGADGEEARSVQGTLILHEQADDLRYFSGSGGNAIPGVTAPLFGTADVPVEAVGALRVGDLMSTDPAAPGVLVIESETPQGPNILLRFGSDANRRDMVRFDGGYTVLELREIGDDGFGGTWTSGIQRLGAAGYFCAVRVAG